jgi:hypothetical protein
MRQVRRAVLAIAASAFMLIGAVTTAQGQAIYDATVTPLPGNLPSLGYEATSTSEFGDAITFAGTARNLKSVTVTLSSWGCETGSWFNSTCVTTPGATFSHPITLNIYAAGNPTPGALIASSTQTFSIPFRPSSDNVNCVGGAWRQTSTGLCFNGLATNVTFDLSSLNVVLPDAVVFGVVYNTTHYGPAPIGQGAPCFSASGGCGYDALNVALSPSVATGSKPYPDTVYWNTSFSGFYCDGGAGGTGTFRIDNTTSGCDWAGLIPAAKFTALSLPTTANACKNGGWQALTRANGTTFKNQGDCIQYVNTGK